jgi:hypothetical protein
MNRNLYRIFTLGVLFFCGTFQVRAQELNAKVKVMHEKILGVDPQVWTSLERSVSDFINTRKWTGDDFNATERIDCNFLINVTARSEKDPDMYTATLSIQATRPIYNSGYNSPTINTIDRDFAFRFTQFNALTFDDNRVGGADAMSANLTAVLAYYAYIIIGLDYDSYSPNGGTAILKKALNVVTNAPEDGSIKGWKAFEEKRNRYWIIDQLLSPRFATYRTAWYTIHREGLDIMWNKPAEGRLKVLSTIATLQQIMRDNQQSTLVQAFFNAKSDEITRIVMQGNKEERTPLLNTLSQIDLVNANKYNNLK